jgi:hypothetical protein
MTVFDGRSSLRISTVTPTAADVSAALELTPTFAVEKGDPRPERAARSMGPTYNMGIWTLDVDADDAAQFAADDDTAGFASLILLCEQLRGKHEVLGTLRDQGCDMYISWYGTSGSSQGGYVMPIELIRELASLGCNLFGNLYSPDDVESSGVEVR